MDGYGSDLLDLYSGDDGVAKARADALARRAQGLQGAGLILKTLAGDRDPAGGILTQMGAKDEDQLAGIAQHRAQQQLLGAHQKATEALQAKHYATEEARQRAQEAYWNAMGAAQGLRAMAAGRGETGVNPLTGETYQKKAPVLVGGTRSAGGGPLVAPGGGGGGGYRGAGSSAPAGAGGMVKDLADQIEAGEADPTMKGMLRLKGPVSAELHRRGFDLGAAANDWNMMQRHTATMEGPRFQTMRNVTDSAYGQIAEVRKAYEDWKQVGAATGFPVANAAALKAMANMPGDAGVAAKYLMQQLTILGEKTGAVIQQGGAPTTEALKLGTSLLSADWNPQQFERGLQGLESTFKIRLNSLKNMRPGSTSGERNRYDKSADVGDAHGAPGPGAPPDAAALRKKYGL